jgi:hypothetical protein
MGTEPSTIANEQAREDFTVLVTALRSALVGVDEAQRDQVLALVDTDPVRAITRAGQLIQGSGNKAAIVPLLELGLSLDDPGLVYTLGLVIARIGGKQASHAAGILGERLDPYDRVGLEWYRRRLAPRKVIARFVALNLAPADRAIEAIKATEPEEGHVYDLADILLRLHQAGGVFMFRTVTRTFPPNHVAVVEKIVAFTRGKVPITNVQEVVDRSPQADDDASVASDLSFDLGDRHHSIRLNAQYSEYDTDNLIRGLNIALDESDTKDRLIPLLAPAGHVALIFGAGKSLVPFLVKEFSLPMDRSKMDLCVIPEPYPEYVPRVNDAGD